MCGEGSEVGFVCLASWVAGCSVWVWVWVEGEVEEVVRVGWWTGLTELVVVVVVLVTACGRRW